MISKIIWNARGIKTQGAMERIQSLKVIHYLSMFAILESFTKCSKLQNCKDQLSMDQAIGNSNGKIWLFWN